MKYVVLFVVALTIATHVHEGYVLPYPSYMPGHKLYRVSRVLDDLKKYWYWGNIAGAKYHIGLSDKYLVEAKILFEYKQYPLALDALKRSDEQFQKISRDSSEANEAHIVLLKKLMSELPESYTWQEEHQSPIVLDLHSALRRSIDIRNE